MDIMEFKDWCRKQIENRPMNMYGTSNTNSVNKRLGVWRQITANMQLRKDFLVVLIALILIRKTLVSLTTQETRVNLKTPMTIEDEDKLLQKCDDNNDDFWGDCFAVAIDTGVRHDGELNRLSPSMINWKTKTLEFKRPKTGNWSSIPLTARAL